VNAPAPALLSEDQLVVLRAVGRGGTATVHQIQGYDGKLLYKKYREPRDPAGAIRLIATANMSDPAVRNDIKSHLAWPVQLIGDGSGRLAGVLVPKAPGTFVASLRTGTKRLRDLNFLLFEERSERVGVDLVALPDKIRIVSSLVRILQLLQGLGLLYEDLAAQNVLWTLDPAPDVYLLDCDSLRRTEDVSPVPLFTTADWTDPRVLSGQISRPDLGSLSYALGLLVARLVLGPTWEPADGDAQAASILPTRLQKIMHAAIYSEYTRPPLDTWLDSLQQAVDQAADTRKRRRRGLRAWRRAQIRGWDEETKRRFATAIGILSGCAAAILIMAVWR